MVAYTTGCPLHKFIIQFIICSILVGYSSPPNNCRKYHVNCKYWFAQAQLTSYPCSSRGAIRKQFVVFIGEQRWRKRQKATKVAGVNVFREYL